MKALAIFALALLVFPVGTYSQTNRTQKASRNKRSPPPVSSVGVDQTYHPSLEAKPDQHVNADVRVVSAPEKDAYDRAAFWISVILAAVGIGGITAAIITLRKIERQTKAMEDAVLEAAASRTLAEYTAKRQLRAYVCVSSGYLKFPDPALPRAIIMVKNCGQTPAYDVKGWCGCVWDKYPSSKKIEPGDKTINSPVSVLGPDIPVSWGTTPGDRLPQELWPDKGTIKCTLYVTGEITYRDAFGDPHYTRYRLLYGGPNHRPQIITESDGSERWTLAPDTEGNEAN